MEQGIEYFAATCIVVLALLIIYQQMQNKPDPDTAERWHKDPNNWKLGIFYFNRQDTRIFPPKKYKSLGWTVNFGNPVSIAGFVVLVTALVYFL
ncbi:MAG: putative transrane protein of unknown function [Flavipsychrobacter sp.]|jgi:uncharacterized membrane protein|nr:putative transrane protein of unknown function [Flavipsychrobacter sp.]